MSSKLILLLFFVPLINYTRQAEVDKQCEHKNYRVVGAALTNLTEEKYYLFLESDENEFGDRFTTFKDLYPNGLPSHKSDVGTISMVRDSFFLKGGSNEYNVREAFFHNNLFNLVVQPGNLRLERQTFFRQDGKWLHNQTDNQIGISLRISDIHALFYINELTFIIYHSIRDDQFNTFLPNRSSPFTGKQLTNTELIPTAILPLNEDRTDLVVFYAHFHKRIKLDISAADNTQGRVDEVIKQLILEGEYDTGHTYNSIWLGCPQDLCFDANFDAATHVPSPTEVYWFLRGAYYWEVSELTNKQMREVKPKLLNSQLPSNIDAAFYWRFGKTTYFFKGSQVYQYNDSAVDKFSQVKDDTFSVLNREVPGFGFDAAALHVVRSTLGTLNETVGFFKGDRLYVMASTGVQNKFNSVTSHKLPVGFPMNVDAAIFHQQDRRVTQWLIFKSEFVIHYSDLNEDTRNPISPIYDFKLKGSENLFGCEKAVYQTKADHPLIRDEVDFRSYKRRTSVDSLEKVREVLPANGRSVATYIGIAAIAVVLVALIIGTVAFLVRRRREDYDDYNGGEFGGNTTTALSQLTTEDTPRKKKKSSDSS